MPLPVVLLAALVLASPGLPVTVDGFKFDAYKEQLSFETTGEVHVQLSQLGSRIVLDIPGAQLVNPVAFKAHRGDIRAILAQEIPGVPGRVRIVLTLASGFEPNVRVQQSADMVFVSFDSPAVSHGEQDFESFPTVPTGRLPQLRDLRQRPDHPAPRAWVWLNTGPAPAPSPPVGLPDVELPVEGGPPGPLESASPPPARGQGGAVRRVGTKSFVLLSFDQAYTVEILHIHTASQPAFTQTETGYITPAAEIEWQHWLGPYLGLGFNARYFDWTEHGTADVLRHQAIGNLQLEARMPWPYVEPEVFGGGAVRYEYFNAPAPFLTHEGTLAAPMVGAGVRFQPLSALGLRLWGRAYPLGLGGDGFWSAGAEFLIDWGYGLASVGYTWDQIAPGVGGNANFGTVVIGLGAQY